ncbi:MAG: alkaline shock response membrane anchor protein AmaP [Firmicutes bacterium]|nr:alkaline shock response membrane anchor protein AmaP [Bacillota bacterium]
MKARERFCLLLLALFFAAAAGIVGGTALTLIPQSAWQTSFSVLYGRLEYVIVAVILLALAVFCLLNSFRREETVETIIQAGTLGEVRISFKAIENLVLKASRSVQGVREVKARILHAEGGIIIFLRALALPDLNLPQVTAELQQAVKSYVEDTTGCTVAEIKVFVENIAADVAKPVR